MKALALKLKALKMPPPLERHDQENLFQWMYFLFYEGERIWDYAYAIPNGAYRGEDRGRAAKHANYLLRQGMKRGYPDVNIDIPVAPYCGLRIELKRIGAPAPKPGDDQSMWHARLRKRGYYVAVCHGFSAAQGVVRAYFKLHGEQS